MKIAKRFLALLLALTLLLGNVVTPVMATEPATEETMPAEETVLVPEETEAPEETESTEEIEETEESREAALTVEAEVDPLPGETPENPISEFYMGMGSINGTIDGYATLYYSVYGIGGMTMTVENGSSLIITVQGQEYSANEEGILSFTLPAVMGRMPVEFSITNGSEDAVSYAMTFAFPVGTMDNPAELTDGETTVSLDAGSQGYYFTYIAEENGTVTMSVAAADAEGNELGWTYVVNNLTSYAYGDAQWSDSDPVVNPAVTEVSKGDELQIMVNTYDAASPWTAPAGDLTLEVSFEAAVGTAMNPAFVSFVMNDEYTAGEATINVPANTTYYCQAYNVGGMILSVNGVDTEILPAAMGRMPVNFTVTNDTDADAEMVLSVRYPEGSQMNPKVIENLGAQNVSLAEGDFDGYYYTYTAEQDATLCFKVNSVSADVEADIVVQNMNTYVMKNISADGVDGMFSMDVSAGDVLNIQVVILPDANWNIAAADVEWDINYPLGSEWNYDYPEFVWNDENTEATATVTVPANTTYYCATRIMGTMILTINGENPTALTGSRMAPTVFTVVNDTDEAAEYVLNLSYPVGSQMNPAELSVFVEGESWDETEGQNVVEMEADNFDGYMYSWTAPADGALTVTMNNGVAGWFYVINNLTTYAYGDNHYSNDGSSNTETIAVSAGDEIQLIVNTCGEPGSYTTPAGQVYFDVYFEKTLGTEANPYFPEWTWNENETEATTEVTVPANTVYYVQGYFNGMMLSINGAEPTLMTSEGFGMPVVFTLENETEEAVTYTLTISYPAGTAENPAELVIGTNTAEIKEDSNGVVFRWIAEETGELTIAMDTDCESWSYLINNLTSYIYGETYASNDEVIIASQTVSVNKGDVIDVQVNTAYDYSVWASPAGTVSFEASFEAAPGTESNPIMIRNPLEWINDTVAGNSAKYYMAYGIRGMKLQFFANSRNVALQIDGQTYTVDKNGVIEITVPGSPMNRMPVTIAVVNNADYEVYYDFGMYYPVGSMNNPDEMVIGKNTAEIEVNSQGYYYSFYVEKNGYLTITMSGKNWTYAINKKAWNDDFGDFVAYYYGDIQAASDGSKTQTIYVECGDQIEIVVGTENWQAGKVSFTAAYNEKEINLVSGKSATLKFTDPATGKAVSGSKVNWAITDFWFYGEYDESISPEELASMITINASGKISTKAGINTAVAVVVEASLKSDAEVGNTFMVYVRPAAKSVEIWSTTQNYVEEEDCYYIELDKNVTGETIDWNISENYDMVLQALVNPQDALGEVTWKSSNTKIATVNEWGDLRPVWNEKTYTYNSGIVTITATAKDGSGVKASVKVNVYALATAAYVYSVNDQYRVTSGKTLKMEAFLDNASNQAVDWSLQLAEVDEWGDVILDYESNDGEAVPASVATINAKGVLSAAKNLTERTFVKVIATAKDGSGTWGCEYVCIDPAAAKVVIGIDGVDEKNQFDMNLGWLSVWAEAQDAEGNTLDTEILWKSSNTKIATFDEYGSLEILKPGKVTLTATANDGTGKKASVTVTIVKSPYQIVMAESYVTAATKALTIKPEVLDADATNKKLTWSLGEETADVAAAIGAKVSNGKVSVNAKKYNAYIAENGLNYVCLTVKAQSQMMDTSWGEATPTATAETVVYIYPATTKVSISQYGKDVTGATLSLDISSSAVLSASSNPEAAQTYTWKSSNTKIADVKVNRDGSVTVIPTGAKTGKVTITATAADGTNKSAKVTVNVVKPVKSLKIYAENFVLAGGKSFDLNKLLEINPADATNKKVTWSISNNTVGAKLAANGKLTTKAVETKTTVYVTAKAQDGFGASATAAITIYPATKSMVIYDFMYNDISNQTVITTLSSFKFKVAPSNTESAGHFTLTLSDYKNFAIELIDGDLAVVQVPDAKGNVKFGKVKLTVTAADGTNKSAYVNIEFVKDFEK